MRSVLIVGGNGFVGSTLAHELRQSFKVTCTHQGAYTPLSGVQYLRLDNLSEKSLCKGVVNKAQPEVVIYCPGSNDILYAEQDARRTQMIQSTGVTHIFSASEPIKAKFIFISSDYVFSGVDGNYNETSTAIPAFQLGKAKLGTENFLRSRCSNHILIRPSPLLGRGPIEHPSFVDSLREAAIRKRKVKLQSKVMRSPVHVSVFVNAVKRVIDQDIRNKILHVSGISKISTAALGKAILERLGMDPNTVELTDANANALPTDYSLNSSETLKVLESDPLLIEQSLELLT